MIPEHVSRPRLSKSRYVSGLQCPLRLWCDCYAPYLAGEPAGSHRVAIRSGRAVGALATELFVGGVRVTADHEHHDDAVLETEALMADSKVSAIFEAGFAHRGVRIRVDVLERAESDCWNLAEVKSGLDVKGINLDDLALQCWVVKGCGVEVERADLITLNREYARGATLELDRLFVRHDCTAEVAGRVGHIADQIETFVAMLAANAPPAVRPAAHCWDPFPCPYRNHCFDEAGGGHPLTELPGLSLARRTELAARGICDVAGLPEGEPLSELQARVRECVCTGEEYVSAGLASELGALESPIHHLAVGVTRPAIPPFPGMVPYQRVPYVWSDTVEEEGAVASRDYLCAECRDPRGELATTLLAATGDHGDVCTYGPLAARVVTGLATEVPRHADRLHALARRIVDLQAVVAEHYYHPDLRGSFAMDRVASVLGVPPCRPQTSLRDEWAAGVAYEESHAGPAADRAECHARVLRFFGRCSAALRELRRTLSARATRLS